MRDRRDFLLTAAVAASAPLLATPAVRAQASGSAAQEGPRLAFAMKTLTGAAIQVGAVSDGLLSVIPLTGGTVDGPRLKGSVLGGGASWIRRRHDGSMEFSVRSLIRAENGQIIADLTRGRIAAPLKDKSSPPGYTVHQFEVPEGPYDWLNNTGLFGVVTPIEGGQHVRVYEVSVPLK